jgi:predicted O-linked N-acetylglucosamine transferase (SPINDLY family)
MSFDEKFLRAIRAYESARYDEAEHITTEILRDDASNFRALNMLGMCLHERGQSESGVALLEQAIALNPGYIPALNNLAAIHNEIGHYAKALNTIDRVLALVPDDAEFHLSKAAFLFAMKDFPRAYASAEQALVLDPRLANAHSMLGLIHGALREFEPALACHERALSLLPSDPKLWLEKARTLSGMDQPDALAACDRAASLGGNPAEVWAARGHVYAQSNAVMEALGAHRKALEIDSSFAEALSGYGKMLAMAWRNEEALAQFDKLLALKPRNAEAWLQRGHALRNLGRHDEASRSFSRAFALEPRLLCAGGDKLFAALQLCDWTGLQEDVRRVVEMVRQDIPAAQPFAFFNFAGSAADQFQCSRSYAKQACPSRDPVWRGERYEHDRIRIAYVSADLCDHVVANIAAGTFERHDRSRFEVTALHFGQQGESAMRSRLKGAFDRFMDVREKSDLAIARLIRELEIDIVIDPSGYTRNARTGIFAHRPAPVQVNWLGFPGTMGVDYIDYIIADETIIPPDEQEFYAEKVVYLPDAYGPSDKRPSPGKPPGRAAAGLPPDGFVFCCLNATQKILPQDFDVWMRILRRVEGSVLWLMDSGAEAKANLGREAEARGVAKQRMIFAPRVPLLDHVARHQLADLFLDTQIYNAHTTAVDSLWAGVPVLTLPGHAFASRVAASFLKAVDLPEMIVSSPEEYEALACKLAAEPDRLAAIKAKLAANRTTKPLFDTARFTRHLDAAYRTMWEHHRRGEKPASFKVPVLD